MIFRELALQGAFEIRPEPVADERGAFVRTFCREEFAEHGCEVDYAQCGSVFNLAAGTLRGLHFQKKPFAETKLVRCTSGEAFDVIVDIRPHSKTFGEWCGLKISARERNAVYIPHGFAHGVQSLADRTEVFYQISTPYHRDASAGVRWNDPTIGVAWPLATPVLSERDRTLPCLGDLE